MRVPVLTQHARFLARSGAVLAIAGAAAGCSSGTMRFQDAIYPNSASTAQPAQYQVAQQGYGQPQPYTPPQGAGVDSTYTGSINRQAVQPAGLSRRPGAPVPSADVGQAFPQASAQPLPPAAAPRQPFPTVTASGNTVTRQPAPALGAPKGLDSTVTGSVAPARPAAPAPQQTASGWSSTNGTLVEARAGDTVASLSRRYGVPADALGKANGLRADAKLAAGQRIVVPTHVFGAAAAQPANPVNTAAGEQNLPAPAKAPQQHVAVLPQGQRLDGKAAPAAPKPAQANANAAATAGAVYTVQSGDTLSSIARKLGTSTAAIRQANGLDNALIRVGQKLVVPGAKANAQVVASAAAPKGVDPIVTGSSHADAKPVNPVAGYTPPRKDDKGIEQAIEQQASAPDASGIGRMRWPVRGRVITGFGGASGDKKNDGIDIAVPEGTPIKAAENGVVIYAGDGLKDFGKTVLVRHENGLVTVYGHASNIEVSRGDTVRRGQEIARSGLSGNADTPKLHFEVRKNSTPVDPVKFLE
jgi:murein DD-endopeptidase MepM/ murein hydrolase activator NlpD